MSFFCFSMILEPENETEYSTCPSNRPKARRLFRRPADRGHPPARRSWPEGEPQPRLTGSPVSRMCPQSTTPSVGHCRLASVLFNWIVKISIENKIVHYRKIRNWRDAERKTVGLQSYPLEVKNFIFWNIFPFSASSIFCSLTCSSHFMCCENTLSVLKSQDCMIILMDSLYFLKWVYCNLFSSLKAGYMGCF